MDKDKPKFSVCASLAGVGVWMSEKKVWSIVEKHMQIKQKVIRFTPTEKLLSALMNILAGGHGMYELETRVRPDRALQAAFGLKACAEQSTVSDTLNACTAENVEQMREAVKIINRRHGQACRHKYEKDWQLLDIDVTGMPTTCRGEGVEKGYFSEKKHRRGRQLGRVTATWYDEVIIDKLYDGKKQLNHSLRELVMAAADVLRLDTARRRHTILRVDGGGGSEADINWMLENGYLVMTKALNHQRSVKLGRSVTTWYPDPKVPGREVGWVTTPTPYVRKTRQLAVRKPKKNGQWNCRIIVFNLPNPVLFHLAGLQVPTAPSNLDILLAVLYAYDKRSGGIETINKQDKQGLGLTKRNKRLFAAQEILVLLAQLAHNLVVWVRNRLAGVSAPLRKLGVLRMVRDVFRIPGQIELDAQGRVLQITLHQSYPFAPAFVQAFSSLLAHDGLSLILGQI